jgi:two-component system, chemotaxis family, chemotaxis protein CheY
MTTVMLVDDSTTILMSLKMILVKAGYAVETAGDGKEALGKLTGGLRPNLIISDVNMPQMDGISFIKEARKTAGLRFIPMLMLTTESDRTKRDEAKTAGATGWLVKPVAPEQLLGVIKQVLPGA